MSTKTRLEDIVIYGASGLISVILIAAGYFLEHQYPLPSHLATEVGIAGIVACFLAFTFERLSERRFKELLEEEKNAIKKDVFHYVLGHRLPEGILAEIDVQILNASLIRENCMASYELTPIESSQTPQRFMKLEVEFSYEIRNLTPAVQPFNFTTIFERAPKEELNILGKFTSVTVRGCAVPLELDDEAKTLAAADPNKRPNHLVIEKGITILPQMPASANIKFEAVKFFEGGTSFILYPLLTRGFDLKVVAPKDVEVLASSYLPEELKKGNKHSPNDDIYHWLLERPILPYQAVYVTWKSKASANAEKRADAVGG